MTWEILRPALPYLAALIYLLVTAVLTVLTTRRRVAIALHDRVRQARLMRLDYLEDLRQRQAATMEEQ